VITSDGRTIEAFVAGPKDGLPLVFHNGTPSSGHLYAPFVEAASARGLRMVSFSRAGYGGSARDTGRSVADVVPDVAALLDVLGARRSYALGWSGGGPHALACAALLPGRTMGAATVGCLAPYAAEGLDWLAGMGQANIEVFRAALAGQAALRAFLERVAPAFTTITSEEVTARLGDLVSIPDRAAIAGEAASWLAVVFRESVRNGIWGWFDDELALVRPWGLDVEDIRIPVAVWQGSQDRMTPAAHGEWLSAHIPVARAHLLPEHGHLSLGMDSFGHILDELLTMTTA
jgi:pimeloyl-ACP methyl ester carboxylesterase